LQIGPIANLPDYSYDRLSDKQGLCLVPTPVIVHKTQRTLPTGPLLPSLL